MKKLSLLFSLLFVAVYCMAQKDSINPSIPHYKILKVDSTYASWTDLKKDKPVMIIYFGPDCPHCQHLMGEMQKEWEPFKNVQVVLITFTRTEFPYMKMIRDFSHNFDLPKYKNITMGTEYNAPGLPAYYVQKYYKVATTPFVALYNRSGKMVASFDKPPKASDLAAAAKKL